MAVFDTGDKRLTCLVCWKVFANFLGQNVHHQVFHDVEGAALGAESRKVRWDPKELAMKVVFEAQYPGVCNINNLIRD